VPNAGDFQGPTTVIAREDVDPGERLAPATCEPAPRDLGRGRSRTRRASRLLVVGLTALLAVPLVVALVALRRPQWYPLMDLALIEMRVRDIGTAHAPLTGLVGRFPVGDNQASHPGPLGFYGLWPFYRLFGSSAYALLAASVAVHVLAIASLLWIASRRGRIGLLLGVSFVVALLARAYGANVLTEAWNPHLPVLWWLVFMFAVWSVVCDDLPLLPLAALAGSLCVQTHVSYFSPVAALGLLALAAACHRTVRNGDRGSRRALALWVAIAAGTTLILWIPPIVDQLRDGTGNLSLLRQYFTDPANRPIGLARGGELLLLHLNPVRLLNGEIWNMDGGAISAEPAGSVVPGLLVLVVWSAAAVASRRLHDRRLSALHVVVVVALLSGVLAMSRIVGFVWYWVVLWAWGITATMLLAAGWTAGLAASRAQPQGRASAVRGPLLVAAAVATAAVIAVFAAESASVEVVTRPSRIVGELLPSTMEALDTDAPPGAGRERRYLVTWSDPVNLGVHGYSLINELERHGFAVGTSAQWAPQVGEHRVMSTEESTAYVHLAGGKFVESVGAQPGAELVAYTDVRTAAERAEYERLREELTTSLTTAGLTDLVPLVDENIWAVRYDPRVDQRVADLAVRMIDIGVPYAVIILPAGVAP
jgi:hypothetical protein